jgi:hypothetical protein
MTIDYAKSLSNLRLRRNGVSEGLVTVEAALAKSERYERRASTTATRYALGAMQEVDPDYTRVGIEEADRVIEQLTSGLRDVGTYAEYKLQGSVPLNVHIRGASDVDLLVLLGPWLTYDRAGPRANSYTAYTGTVSVLQDVKDLRINCEDILTRRYWGAKVDTTGDKSIKLSEGSFKRQIDVVPSHWNDSAEYQASASEADRGVCILHKSRGETISNLPFRHIARINAKDGETNGGAKRAIRLLKNLKADTDRPIDLSSYDIAALMWHCDPRLIRMLPGYELVVLAGTDAHLAALASNYTNTSALETPDGTRRIIDKPGKFDSLVALSAEVSALADAVLVELQPLQKAIINEQEAVRRLLRDHAIAD